MAFFKDCMKKIHGFSIFYTPSILKKDLENFQWFSLWIFFLIFLCGGGDGGDGGGGDEKTKIREKMKMQKEKAKKGKRRQKMAKMNKLIINEWISQSAINQ